MRSKQGSASVTVGDVAAMPLPGGGFGACQVAGVGKDTIQVYVLDWYSSSLPALDELATAAPLRCHHHAHGGTLAHVNVSADEPAPVDFVWLGTRPVGPGVPEQTNSFASWTYLPTQVLQQRRWDQVIPAGMRAAYKAADANLTSRVRVDFGAGPTDHPLGTSSLDLVSDVRMPASGPVHWEQLDSLPKLTGLRWRGDDRGLIFFARPGTRARPLPARRRPRRAAGWRPLPWLPVYSGHLSATQAKWKEDEECGSAG